MPSFAPGPAAFPPLNPTTAMPSPSDEPHPSRRGRVVLAGIAAVAVIGLAAGAIVLPTLTAKPTQPGATPQPTSTTISTATPAPQPADQVVLTSGGDIGATLDFRTTTGAGRLTVTKATWSSAGELAPPAGSRYLIAEIRVTCTQGTITVSPLDVVAGPQPDHGAAFGPTLNNPLAGSSLRAGQDVTGEVGFVLAPALTRVALRDSRLKPVATVEVPAP
jgi:hypothetical protein